MDKDYNRLELITRFIIFIPLIVVILFMIKSNHEGKVALSQRQASELTVEQGGTNTPDEVPSVNSNSISLDLNGPYICSYTDGDISVNASVQNKKISINYSNGQTLSNIIVTNDCGYMWNEGENIGEKMCNISQYLSMVEMLSSLNILEMDSIFSMIQEVDPSLTIDQDLGQQVMDTCIKKEIDASVFDVPTSITFTDIQSVTPAIVQ